MKASGRMENVMAKESSSTQMDIAMRGNSRMVISKVKVLSI